MKDDRKKFQEFAELAGRRKEHLLHRLGQPPKPESQLGQVLPPGAAAVSQREHVWLVDHTQILIGDQSPHAIPGEREPGNERRAGKSA